MSDDAFHLTPGDVRAQEFRRGFRGYEPEQVEEFKQRVADELDRLLRERAMNEALLAAQQLRVAAQEQAEKEAESIVREARTDALRLVGQAQEEERQVRERMEGLQRQFAAYLANFRALLERQLGEVEGLQSHATITHQVQTELLLKRHA